MTGTEELKPSLLDREPATLLPTPFVFSLKNLKVFFYTSCATSHILLFD